MGTTTQKMASVVKSVESDKITVQQSLEEIGPNRQHSVDFTAWERGMQKEANLDILLPEGLELHAQHFRKKHQVVVMYPYQIPIPRLLRNSLGKQGVCFLVRVPGCLVKDNLPRMIVQKWP
jgi:hypothetical protein